VKLDEILKLSEHELFDHAGKISAEQAKTKAELEYARYRVLLDASPRAVDVDFEKATKELKKRRGRRNPSRRSHERTERIHRRGRRADVVRGAGLCDR